jgi:hypothetical protein
VGLNGDRRRPVTVRWLNSKEKAGTSFEEEIYRIIRTRRSKVRTATKETNM